MLQLLNTPQENPFQDCPAEHALLVSAHAPLRDCPRGQTPHGAFRQAPGVLNSAFCTGFAFLKGWKNERELCFSGAAFSLLDDSLEDGDLVDDDCDTVLALPACDAELLKA